MGAENPLLHSHSGPPSPPNTSLGGGLGGGSLNPQMQSIGLLVVITMRCRFAVRSVRLNRRGQARRVLGGFRGVAGTSAHGKWVFGGAPCAVRNVGCHGPVPPDGQGTEMLSKGGAPHPLRC